LRGQDSGFGVASADKGARDLVESSTCMIERTRERIRNRLVVHGMDLAHRIVPLS
jgi:hypothetical protein